MIPSISIFGPNPNSNFKCITLHSLTLTPTTHSLSIRIYIPLFFILLFLCSHFSFCSPQSPEREWVQSHRLLLRQGIHLNRLHHSFDAKYVSFCSLIQRFFFFFCNLACLFLDLFNSTTLYFLICVTLLPTSSKSYLDVFVSDYLYSYCLIYTEWDVVDCGDL